MSLAVGLFDVADVQVGPNIVVRRLAHVERVKNRPVMLGVEQTWLDEFLADGGEDGAVAGLLKSLAGQQSRRGVEHGIVAAVCRAVGVPGFEEKVGLLERRIGLRQKRRLQGAQMGTPSDSSRMA